MRLNEKMAAADACGYQIDVALAESRMSAIECCDLMLSMIVWKILEKNDWERVDAYLARRIAMMKTAPAPFDTNDSGDEHVST